MEFSEKTHFPKDPFSEPDFCLVTVSLLFLCVVPFCSMDFKGATEIKTLALFRAFPRLFFSKK